MADHAENLIKERIRASGPITFAEFMAMALYGPGGYYSSGNHISASGDYFTATSAHPAFGALIAVQLREMWQILGEPGEFTAVEIGAGSGGLAADVTEFAERLDARFASSLGYQAFDLRPLERQHFPVRPVEDLPRAITGCVLSNELLDATPVRRFEVRDGGLLEICVGLEDDRLVEVLSEPSTPVIAERVGPLLHTLPDGYRGEVNDGLDEWAKSVARVLRRGWALTIDYGFDRAELYSPHRVTGSLRCYHQHTLGQDPLRHVGRQDITAHVDFTAVDEAMTRAGFEVAGHTTQSAFLESLGMDILRDALRAMPLSRPEMRANEAGMHALVDQAGMGGFRVAVHSRGVSGALGSMAGGQSADDIPHLSPPPLLNASRHINLLGPAQPGGYFEVQSLEDLLGE